MARLNRGKKIYGYGRAAYMASVHGGQLAYMDMFYF